MQREREREGAYIYTYIYSGRIFAREIFILCIILFHNNRLTRACLVASLSSLLRFFFRIAESRIYIYTLARVYKMYSIEGICVCLTKHDTVLLIIHEFPFDFNYSSNKLHFFSPLVTITSDMLNGKSKTTYTQAHALYLYLARTCRRVNIYDISLRIRISAYMHTHIIYITAHGWAESRSQARLIAIRE